MGMQNFSCLACDQTGLDTFLTIFEENSLANFKKSKSEYAILYLT
jgi:hypothetical protein